MATVLVIIRLPPMREQRARPAPWGSATASPRQNRPLLLLLLIAFLTSSGGAIMNLVSTIGRAVFSPDMRSGENTNQPAD